MVRLDGSLGEGGGQILRSALALSLVTSRPFTIERIRAKRRTPGLLRQHLTAVRAAMAFGAADVEGAELCSQAINGSAGPGNVLLIEIGSTHVTELFTGFGEHGVRAEQVAAHVIEDVRSYLAAGVPVGRHLADQLLVPMAMAGAGSFRTQALSRHAQTNIEVVQQFFPKVPIAVDQEARDRVYVRIGDPSLRPP
jgi:RNA 3'-terminal phosphate cyclase (ATP)